LATAAPGTRVTITPSATPDLSGTPTRTPTSISQNAKLTGFKHEYQTWNNCGPTTLSMALSFWDWEGNQQPFAAFTKPNSRDKNVMPYELTDFVEEKTKLMALSRVGGMASSYVAGCSRSSFPGALENSFPGSSTGAYHLSGATLTGLCSANTNL
jgi:hypothetical protein